MIRLERELAAGRRAHVRFSDRGDGDFAPSAADVLARRRALSGHPWTWLHQVHGATVVVVDHPGQHVGASADGALTAVEGAVVAVCTADCAPVVLLGSDAVAVAHAGWRGTLDGVLEVGVSELLALRDGPVTAIVGPCIRPTSYEFGDEDLERMTEQFGPEVRASTDQGAPALDLAAAVRAALAPVVTTVVDLGLDTSDERWFSSRVRGDAARQVAAVWLEP